MNQLSFLGVHHRCRKAQTEDDEYETEYIENGDDSEDNSKSNPHGLRNFTSEWLHVVGKNKLLDIRNTLRNAMFYQSYHQNKKGNDKADCIENKLKFLKSLVLNPKEDGYQEIDRYAYGRKPFLNN